MEKGFCELNISQLVRADWNYKNDSPALAEKLANNIRRNGQVENIIVRELDTGLFEVVNGNHRLDVLRSLKFEKVFCYNLGRVSLAQAKRVAVETNETKFDNDIDKLETILVEISNEFGLDDMLTTMPLGEDYIKGLIDESEVDVSSFFEDGSKVVETKPRELICPHCGRNVYED